MQINNHIATFTIFNAMRDSTARMQTELVRLQEETVTGRLADAGMQLGARSAELVSFKSDVAEIDRITDTNKMVLSRLEVTQLGIGRLGTIADDLLQTVGLSLDDDAQRGVVQSGVENALAQIADTLNTRVDGAHLFAGVNSDAGPIADHVGGPGEAAFDAAFLTHFGFAKTDAAAAAITAADMTTFLETVIEPDFMGAGWTTHYSSASDEAVTGRIGPDLVADVSVTANEAPMRRLMMAAVVAREMHGEAFGGEARQAAAKFAIAEAGQAGAELAELSGRTGLIEERVARQNETLLARRDMLDGMSNNLEAVDRYEASARLTSLLTQIEASYATTARIQQMSLLRYL